MSVIKKCDICGMTYEPYGVIKDPENPNGFAWLNIQTCGCGSPSYVVNKPVTDTCRTCLNRIRDFIKGLIDEANAVPEEPPVEPPEEGDGNENPDGEAGDQNG